MACAKTIRKRDKALARIRRDKEAKKRRKARRMREYYGSSKPKPGYWLDSATADIHAAIVGHLKLVTRELVKGLVQCRTVGHNQSYYSDLAFSNRQVFFDYNMIIIKGDTLTIAAHLIPRKRYEVSDLGAFTRRINGVVPLWSKDCRFILSDPQLFTKLSNVAAAMANAYYQHVEYPNHGA